MYIIAINDYDMSCMLVIYKTGFVLYSVDLAIIVWLT